MRTTKGFLFLAALVAVVVGSLWWLNSVETTESPIWAPMAWMFSTFVEQPWLALIPVLLFSVLFTVRRQRLRWLQFIPITAWALYFLWEGGISLSCGPISEGDCNIRIDLLLIYPVLLAATIFGVVVFVAGAMWKKEAPHN